MESYILDIDSNLDIKKVLCLMVDINDNQLYMAMGPYLDDETLKVLAPVSGGALPTYPSPSACGVGTQ